jgi:glyoxylase-like metal-dependent hydrolase (beta-lactamase superfamily II)
VSARAWTEPATDEVAPGIWRIPLPLPDDGLRAVNVYAIADGEQVVLVDSGWALAESEDALVRALDSIGYTLPQVSRFLITHAHRDRYTQAVAIRRSLGAQVPLATRTLRALATPGHTQGHTVFYDTAAGVLFAGDHVLPHITPSIGFEPFPGESPLGDYLASLLLVRTMPDARLLPAHGAVGDSVHARVDQLLEHHGARLDQRSPRSPRARTPHARWPVG